MTCIWSVFLYMYVNRFPQKATESVLRQYKIYIYYIPCIIFIVSESQRLQKCCINAVQSICICVYACSYINTIPPSSRQLFWINSEHVTTQQKSNVFSHLLLLTSHICHLPPTPPLTSSKKPQLAQCGIAK